MNKLIWTVLITFVLAFVPLGGTARAGQGHAKSSHKQKHQHHYQHRQPRHYHHSNK